jgi:KUP system potassium uptake protein
MRYRPGAEIHSRRGAAKAAIVVAALGVVFGDIGTSPIYTVQTVFNPKDPHPVKATTDSVFGITSLIFWSVMTIVTVTYVLLVMRADNQGEGGIMALITLVARGRTPGRRRTMMWLAALGVFGASLFLGDSMITPAISVLSAVEGVKVAEPGLADLVVPITAGIIVALFVLQRLGSAAVGRLFGPVMTVWFLTIAAFGVRGITNHPAILKALSPTYAASYLFGHFGTAFFALAAIVLAVTGAEALYADMGHFGRGPVTRAWLFLVFPALTLSYMGQGAMIVENPAKNIHSPFFLLAPGWAQWPLVILATAATVIASQAVITGAFSVAYQAVQLGYLPRLRIVHTSEHEVGQVYVPWINWLLMLSVLTLVLTFKTSAGLAYAYGAAVTGTITITTLLFFYIARRQWGRPVWLVAVGAGFLLSVDLLFLAANLTKIVHGAWLPLLIAVTAFTVLTTWRRGRELVTERRVRLEGPLRGFVDGLHERKPAVERGAGTGVFLNRNKLTAPLAMRASVERLHALPQDVVILSIETVPSPHVPVSERVVIDDLGYGDDGIAHVTARFGYMDTANVPDLLRLIRPEQIECRLDVDEASYFLSTIELVLSDEPGMSPWRKRLFLATAHIAADASEYFALPRDRTVIMGSRIDV